MFLFIKQLIFNDDRNILFSKNHMSGLFLIILRYETQRKKNSWTKKKKAINKCGWHTLMRNATYATERILNG